MQFRIFNEWHQLLAAGPDHRQFHVVAGVIVAGPSDGGQLLLDGGQFREGHFSVIPAIGFRQGRNVVVECLGIVR